MSRLASSLLLLAAIGSGGAPARCEEPGPGGPRSPAHAGPVTDIAFVCGRRVSCSQAGVFIQDLEGGADRLLYRPGFRVLALAPAGSGLLLGGGEPGVSGDVELVMLAADGSEPVRPLEKRIVAKDIVYAVSVAPDGSAAALALADGRVLLLDLPGLDGARPVHEHTAAARDVLFSPDGTRLASAGLDGAVLLSEFRESGAPLALVEHTAGVEALAFSADSSLIASGARDGKVRLHGAGGRFLRTYPKLSGEVWSLEWDAEAGLLAGLADGRIISLPEDPGEPPVEVAHAPAGVRALRRAARDRLHAGVRGGVWVGRVEDGDR